MVLLVSQSCSVGPAARIGFSLTSPPWWSQRGRKYLAGRMPPASHSHSSPTSNLPKYTWHFLPAVFRPTGYPTNASPIKRFRPAHLIWPLLLTRRTSHGRG